MAFKWTKAARAKLSRSQKARWKERKRQQRRKRAKRSPDSAIGVVKIGASVAVTSVPYFASRAAAMRRRRNQNTLAHTGERTRRWRQRYRGRQAAIVPMSKSRSICRVHGWKDRPTLPTDRCWLTGTLHGAAPCRTVRSARTILSGALNFCRFIGDRADDGRLCAFEFLTFIESRLGQSDHGIFVAQPLPFDRVG